MCFAFLRQFPVLASDLLVAEAGLELVILKPLPLSVPCHAQLKHWTVLGVLLIFYALCFR